MASYEKRGKKTRVVVSVTEGTVRKKVSRTFATKKEAQKWAVKMEAERNDGINIAGSSLTYAEYCEQWVHDFKIDNVKPITAKMYLSHIKTIKNIFGSITLSQLSHAVLQHTLDEYGENKQTSTVNALLVTIKASLKDALYDGYIPRDIFSRVKPHGKKERPERVKALSAAQFEKLQAYLFNNAHDINNLCILTMLETGIRVGECLALNYNDVNTLFDTISVTKTYSSDLHTITKPKTKTSVRNIKVTHELAQMLTNRLDRRNYERFFNMTIFPVGRHLKELLDYLDLPQITVHGLRHSHASYLLYKGVSINYVSARLGHANTAITQLVYAHMLPEEQTNEAEKAVELLSKSPIVPKARLKH